MAEMLTLTASDGHKFQAYLAQPSGKPKGGIVVVQEIFGVNSHIRSVVDGYAADGYLTIAPALFDRVEPGIELGYEADDIAQGRDLKDKCGNETPLLDIQAAVNAVQSAGKVGVVGYCWGGTLTWLSGTRLEGVAAVSGYYGGGIGNYAAETPKAAAMMHFGENDHAIPLDEVAKINEHHADIPVHIYPAGHGFNCDQRGSFDAKCSEIARERTIAHFAKHVG